MTSPHEAVATEGQTRKTRAVRGASGRLKTILLSLDPEARGTHNAARLSVRGLVGIHFDLPRR